MLTSDLFSRVENSRAHTANAVTMERTNHFETIKLKIQDR